MVWQLKKALYSLKQAGLEWYCTLRGHIQSIGYAQSGHDPCLYMLDSETFIIVYVDDLMVFAQKNNLVQAKLELARKYEMCDLGKAHWFLTMEITCDRVTWTISIDQHQYIWKILRHFRLDKTQLVSTPMAANLKLPKMESPTIDQCMYQSMLGSLMYVAIRTQPDIMFTIHYLSQHSIAPGEKHLNTMKCVYCYLNGTLDLGLLFYGNKFNCDLVGFSNLDWAGDPNTWRSVSGYAFLFCRAVIAWSVKKQLTIALFSTKGNYMAMTHSGKEIVCLNHLFNSF